MTDHLFDKAPCGYFAFADDGTLVDVNDTLCTILQHTKESLRGGSVERLLTLPARIFFQTHLFPLVKMHGHAEEIFLNLHTSGGKHLPVLLNAQRSDWQGRPLTACVFIVVPHRKKFEDELVAARKTAEAALQENTELAKAKAELQQHAEQLELQMRLANRQNHELKQFSHAVTHNLKEPLRKLLLFAGKLEATTGLPDVHKVLQSAGQLKAVVSGLQQYVWLTETGKHFTRVDLNETVLLAAAALKAELGSDLLSVTSNNLAALQGDAAQLQLLVYHLLANAIQFRKGEKAEVTIQTTLLKQNTFRAVEGRYRYADFVRLEVTDQGTGFDPAYKDQVFELFRKLHFSDRQGLGLALCRKIAENHGGYIDADSRLGGATTITVWLPAEQGDISPEATLI